MNKEHNKLIAKRIQELMEEKNITQNRLATLANLTPSTINSIYEGKSKNPTIKTINCICDALNISVKDFFDYPPYNTKENLDQTPKEIMKHLKKLTEEIERMEQKINDIEGN